MPQLQQCRRLEHVGRVGIARPHDILQASPPGGEKQIWAESKAGRLIGAVVDPSGCFVVTCVPWFGLVWFLENPVGSQEGGPYIWLSRVKYPVQRAVKNRNKEL